MKRFIMIVMLLFATACSAESNMESAKSESSLDQSASTESQANSKSAPAEDKEKSTEENKSANDDGESGASRMVIYNAELSINVKKLQNVQGELTKIANELGGYVVESNISDYTEQLEGYMMARIPQKEFTSYISAVEKSSLKVNNKTIKGQDVTEEFVDLSSRISSLHAVEERLLSFLKEAKNTEDLLKISKDLAIVQEQIEQTKGRMNYLENQTELSTVTIHLFENKVVVPPIGEEKLDTVAKTKQQFISSVNFLLAFMSGVVVFIIGNSPVLLIFGMIIFCVFYFARKNKKQRGNME